MQKKPHIFAERRRFLLVTLSIVTGLAVLLLAAGVWQNYSWVHRSLNRYEDELPLYGIVAVGKTASAPKEELRQLISTADILYNPSPKLQETRWYKDMMRQIGPKITLTPEDILIIGMYATNDEDKQGAVDIFQKQTIEVAYNGDGALVLGGSGNDDSGCPDENA